MPQAVEPQTPQESVECAVCLYEFPSSKMYICCPNMHQLDFHCFRRILYDDVAKCPLCRTGISRQHLASLFKSLPTYTIESFAKILPYLSSIITLSKNSPTFQWISDVWGDNFDLSHFIKSGRADVIQFAVQNGIVPCGDEIIQHPLVKAMVCLYIEPLSGNHQQVLDLLLTDQSIPLRITYSPRKVGAFYGYMTTQGQSLTYLPQRALHLIHLAIVLNNLRVFRAILHAIPKLDTRLLLIFILNQPRRLEFVNELLQFDPKIRMVSFKTANTSPLFWAFQSHDAQYIESVINQVGRFKSDLLRQQFMELATLPDNNFLLQFLDNYLTLFGPYRLARLFASFK